ncbi:hypothetical protein VPH35_032845 [Triticum aestivum]
MTVGWANGEDAGTCRSGSGIAQSDPSESTERAKKKKNDPFLCCLPHHSPQAPEHLPALNLGFAPPFRRPAAPADPARPEPDVPHVVVLYKPAL